MKAYYKNDLSHAYLILEGMQEGEEDYQIHMLKENKIAGVLKTDIRYVDEQGHYYYDISGKVSLKAIHEKAKLTYGEMRRLVEALLSAIRAVHKYMLEGSCLLLEPEYIFCEKEEVFFCYYPPCKGNLGESFHRLTEYFVKEVDYQDEEGVRLAYTLHKATMCENYSIEKIMEEFTREKEEKEVSYGERTEEVAIETIMIAEKKDFWNPVRNLIERTKKERWGSWDNIYIEEEKL